jgi:hypothetical protein
LFPPCGASGTATASQWNAFVMAQAKAGHPEFPGRFFNVGFILSPQGEILLATGRHSPAGG